MFCANCSTWAGVSPFCSQPWGMDGLPWGSSSPVASGIQLWVWGRISLPAWLWRDVCLFFVSSLQLWRFCNPLGQSNPEKPQWESFPSRQLSHSRTHYSTQYYNLSHFFQWPFEFQKQDPRLMHCQLAACSFIHWVEWLLPAAKHKAEPFVGYPEKYIAQNKCSHFSHP